MTMLAKKAYRAVRRVFATAKAVSAPERVYGESRPMTGFLATLTDEQRKRALAYRGDDSHGDPKLLRKPA